MRQYFLGPQRNTGGGKRKYPEERKASKKGIIRERGNEIDS